MISLSGGRSWMGTGISWINSNLVLTSIVLGKAYLLIPFLELAAPLKQDFECFQRWFRNFSIVWIALTSPIHLQMKKTCYLQDEDRYVANQSNLSNRYSVDILICVSKILIFFLKWARITSSSPNFLEHVEQWSIDGAVSYFIQYLKARSGNCSIETSCFDYIQYIWWI